LRKIPETRDKDQKMTRKFSVIAPGVMFPPVGFATRKFALPVVGKASTSKPPAP